LLRALNNHKVRYILIGGHAAIFYGVRRNTGDLDIFIEATLKNGELLLEALKSIGLEVPEFQPEEFTQKLVLSFGLEPDAVDILNYTPGIEFNSAYIKAQDVNFEGVNTKILDIRDLIKNKESLNREGEKSLLDQYDVEVLKRILRDKNQD
jgi:predicted nucleotidyltransferase